MIWGSCRLFSISSVVSNPVSSGDQKSRVIVPFDLSFWFSLFPKKLALFEENHDWITKNHLNQSMRK